MMDNLTKQQREVARLMLAGKLSKEIAVEMGISQKTVDHYRCEIYTKLNIHSLFEFFSLACKSGFFQEPERVYVSELDYQTCKYFGLSDYDIRFINNILKWQKNNNGKINSRAIQQIVC